MNRSIDQVAACDLSEHPIIFDNHVNEVLSASVGDYERELYILVLINIVKSSLLKQGILKSV